MKKTSPLLQKAQDYVFNLLREKLSPSLIYHNYLHTAEVVEAANEVSEGCNLSKEDSEVITLAAWFHDTGLWKSMTAMKR
jgi:HD superfamily phosphodiesterase